MLWEALLINIMMAKTTGCLRDKEDQIMLRRVLGLASVVAAAGVLLIVTASAGAAGGTVDASLLPAGEFEGVLRSVPGTDRMFTLTVSVPQVTVNPNVRANYNLQSHINNVLSIQRRMLSSKHPGNYVGQLQGAVIRLQQQAAIAQANAVRVHTVTQHIEFQAAEDVKVRTLKAPEVFDDKGKIRKHTPEELKQLKGKNPNLIGYESSLEAMAKGQVVRVTLASHHSSSGDKGKPDAEKDKDPAAEKDKNPDKKKPAGEGDLSEKKMQVRMIVIASEGGSAGRSDSPGKPAKDNK
jgi:hypothetical protein